MFDCIILGIVLDKSLTGYDIKKEIESKIGNFYKVSHGKLYPTLKKLADKSFLTMNEEMQGGRQKKYYQATESGKTAFFEWLTSPIDLNANAEAQLVQIFFYGKLSKETREKRLQEYEFLIQQQVQQLEAIAKGISSEDMSDEDYFETAILYFGIHSTHNSLRWLKYIKEQKHLSQLLCENEK